MEGQSGFIPEDGTLGFGYFKESHSWATDAHGFWWFLLLPNCCRFSYSSHLTGCSRSC